MARKGDLKCLCCAQGIVVKENERGTLNVNCPWCDFSGYAKKGTQAARKIEAAVAWRADDTAPADDKPADKAPPKKSGSGLPDFIT
jgi:hypothetical protein